MFRFIRAKISAAVVGYFALVALNLVSIAFCAATYLQSVEAPSAAHSAASSAERASSAASDATDQAVLARRQAAVATCFARSDALARADCYRQDLALSTETSSTPLIGGWRTSP